MQSNITYWPLSLTVDLAWLPELPYLTAWWVGWGELFSSWLCGREATFCWCSKLVHTSTSTHTSRKQTYNRLVITNVFLLYVILKDFIGSSTVSHHHDHLCSFRRRFSSSCKTFLSCRKSWCFSSWSPWSFSPIFIIYKKSRQRPEEKKSVTLQGHFEG